jgi:hypothetical protein
VLSESELDADQKDELQAIERSMKTLRPGGRQGYGRYPFDSDWVSVAGRPSRTGGLLGSGGFGGTGWQAGSEVSQGVPLDEETKAAIEQKRQTIVDGLNRLQEAADTWIDHAYAHAWTWYQKDQDDVKKTAKDQARDALTVDFSALRGRGPEFVLEFTAIVVIIFAALILGVVKILDGQQIGTLLAAIAGYVLGKSTSRAHPASEVPQGAARTAHMEEPDKTRTEQSLSPH